MVKINKVVLTGRMVKDPELRFIQNTGTATTTITLAVDKYNAKTKEREADFINVVVWGKQAENLAEYTVKGSQIAISGRIQTRSYEAKDGTKRYVTEVVANEIEFLGNKTTKKEDKKLEKAIDFGEDAEIVDDDGMIPF